MCIRDRCELLASPRHHDDVRVRLNLPFVESLHGFGHRARHVGETAAVAGEATLRRHTAHSTADRADEAAVRVERERADVAIEARPVVVLSLIHISEPTRLLSISYAVF